MKSLVVALLCVASPASAAEVQAIVSAIGAPGADGALPVEVTLLNGGDATDLQAPARVPAEVAIGGIHSPVTLERAADSPKSAQVPAGGFARFRYTLHVAAAATEGMTGVLTVRDWGPTGTAFALPARADAAPEQRPIVRQAVAAASADTGNAFLGALSAYQPIYAVYAPGTDTEARLQFSLKFQLFGKGGALGGAPSLLDGLYFAYTQKMFWDLRAPSSPLRDVDYMPEVFYLLPGKALFSGVSIGGQVGVLHESNGRDGATSRAVNTLYVQPVATALLGRWKLSAGPRLWAYLGGDAQNADITRYRGNTGLFAQIGRDNGLRLTTNSRYNFSTGRGAIDADLSYPLDKIIDRKLNLYVFVQGFTGYGENLLDYYRRETRVRAGVGIVR